MDPIKSPLRVPINLLETKHFILNLNQYRNTHFHILNRAKQTYTRTLKLSHLPNYTKIELTLVIHAKNKRKFDVDNVASVHAKFFLDSLVKAGKLPDDTYDYVPRIVSEFGSICKDDPRVDIFIKEL